MIRHAVPRRLTIGHKIIIHFVLEDMQVVILPVCGINIVKVSGKAGIVKQGHIRKTCKHGKTVPCRESCACLVQIGGAKPEAKAGQGA